MNFLYSMEELIFSCQGSDVIAYGTGKVGKVLIPMLSQNTDLSLRGVTNSRVADDERGSFLDTGLPIRNLRYWYEQFPGALILVTTSNHCYQKEIERICTETGFKRIVHVHPYMNFNVVDARLETMISPQNRALFELLLPKINFFLTDRMCFANEVRDVHKASFGEFRGCHRNKNVVLVGSGPSLNYYSQLKGLPHIGVNSSFLKSGIKLDYYFLRDYAGKPAWVNELKNYDFVKFLGESGWTREGREIYQLPESLIEENHGRRFFTQPEKEYIHCDIEHYPVMGLQSIIFGAFHFALYTMPKKILLVGCDCSDAGHFNGGRKETPSGANIFIESWKWVDAFVKRYYPSIEVISVNPVGLRGMFREIYTESYLEAHPEIASTKCSVIDAKEFEER